ncbi:MAG TPA: formate dehydrogenase accessory sulfurtransferase FdhD [Abditibacteriaceae bacterium]|jgi:FdhD protein
MHQKQRDVLHQSTETRTVTRLRNGVTHEVADCLVVEEPLEIRISGRRFTTTMRTPGHDIELARGLLFTEGVVRDNDDIEEIITSTRCREHNTELINVVNVTVPELEALPDHLWERALISNSSCGLCGKASIEALKTKVALLPDHSPVAMETLLRLPHLMREKQELFQSTGGLHAAGIFTARGECLALFEDIGRHNATDKAIGCGLRAGWLPCATQDEPLVLLVSGRSSFEITQKALMARIPVVCSVSAASTLAVELAAANNQTLIGFLRDASCTIYCGQQRVC